MIKHGPLPHRSLAALCAAALLLCPLATGAGKLEDLTGDAYVLHSEVTPPAPTSSGKLNSFVEDGVIQVSDLKKVAKEYSTVPEDFLDAISGKDSITVERFEEYALDYKLPGQYVQRFIDDYFVFKQDRTCRWKKTPPIIATTGTTWSTTATKRTTWSTAAPGP